MINPICLAHGHAARRRFHDSPRPGRHHVQRTERMVGIRAVQEYRVSEVPHLGEQSDWIGLKGEGGHTGHRPQRWRAA